MQSNYVVVFQHSHSSNHYILRYHIVVVVIIITDVEKMTTTTVYMAIYENGLWKHVLAIVPFLFSPSPSLFPLPFPQFTGPEGSITVSPPILSIDFGQKRK